MPSPLSVGVCKQVHFGLDCCILICIGTFEEPTIALLPQYVHVSLHVRAKLRRSSDAGLGSGWNGLWVVRQRIGPEVAYDGRAAPQWPKADKDLERA